MPRLPAFVAEITDQRGAAIEAQARMLAMPRLARARLRGATPQRAGGEIACCLDAPCHARRSEEHPSELQSLMRTSYAVFCLKQKQQKFNHVPQHVLRIQVHHYNNNNTLQY